jgi:hypothetical protein
MKANIEFYMTDKSALNVIDIVEEKNRGWEWDWKGWMNSDLRGIGMEGPMLWLSHITQLVGDK